MANQPFDAGRMVDAAVRRLVAIADRAHVLARGVLVFAGLGGALAYAVGFFAFPSSFRLVWAIVGLVVCAAPALSVFIADRRLRAVRASVDATSIELRNLVNDRAVRAALFELVDHDEGYEQSMPLVKLGKELNDLRRATSGHRELLSNTWQSVVALTSLPGLVALATVGTFGLFAFSAIAVVVRLVMLAG